MQMRKFQHICSSWYCIDLCLEQCGIIGYPQRLRYILCAILRILLSQPCWCRSERHGFATARCGFPFSRKPWRRLLGVTRSCMPLGTFWEMVLEIYENQIQSARLYMSVSFCTRCLLLSVRAYPRALICQRGGRGGKIVWTLLLT